MVDAAQAGRGARDFGTTLAGVDGLASGEKDLPLMLFYADCTPIMIVDPVQKEQPCCMLAGGVQWVPSGPGPFLS